MFPIFAGNSASTGYNLTRSLRTRASASGYLSRTPATTSNQKTWTWSGWIKRGILGQSAGSSPYFFNSSSAGTDAAFFAMGFNGDAFTVTGYATNYLTTTQVFRDPSAWYHIVVAVDTSQATTSNRIKVYVNGSQVTAFSTANYVAQNFNTPVNLNQAHYLCAFNIGSGVQNFNDLYLAEVNFVDGQQLTPSSFGSTNALTGVWQPARYTGTYGTNGFYLPFTDNSALTTSSNVGLGKDFSGNGNYWTTNNISITAGVTYDSMTDVPTLTSATEANFAVLNPLDTIGITASNGNLLATASASADIQFIRATVQYPSTGKYYFESQYTSSNGGYIGVALSSAQLGYNAAPIYYNALLYRAPNGNKLINSAETAYGASFTVGDVIGVAVDVGAGIVTFYKNNTSQGAITYSTSGGYAPVVAMYSSTTMAVNFGQRPFSYTPPTGFVALNTYNLPTSTIVKGNTVMDATLYTGTGASLSVTNAASFKPDLVWVKDRSILTNNKLTDSVRGVTKAIISNSTNAETTDTQGVTAFNTNGFTVGTDTTYNSLADTYVGWQWQAGQGSSSSNTNGSITSTVSVNASAGFSIATFTGTGANGTVGHGLGVAPSMYIVKSRSAVGDWWVYHVSLGAGKAIFLSLTDAAASSTGYWNNTAPTSSVFSVGTAGGLNVNGVTQVAYCWTPIAGFSAFGSYTGNGSTDGTFVYTGFRPKFVMIKRTDSANNWVMFDSSRDTYNAVVNTLSADSTNSESTFGSGYNIDFLSNGFKPRNATGAENASGGTYIYMAYAENPFKNALAR